MLQIQLRMSEITAQVEGWRGILGLNSLLAAMAERFYELSGRIVHKLREMKTDISNTSSIESKYHSEGRKEEMLGSAFSLHGNG